MLVDVDQAVADLGGIFEQAFRQAARVPLPEDARGARQRWIAEARFLARTAFEADSAWVPLSGQLAGAGESLLIATWDRRHALVPADIRDVGRLPGWVHQPAPDRMRLAVLGGAIVRARRLRQTIDGAVLAGVADVIGERALDDVLRIHAARGVLHDAPWGDDPVRELAGLGGEVLARTSGCTAGNVRRLAMLFPPSRSLADADPAALQRIAADATMILAGPAAREPGPALVETGVHR